MLLSTIHFIGTIKTFPNYLKSDFVLEDAQIIEKYLNSSSLGSSQKVFSIDKLNLIKPDNIDLSQFLIGQKVEGSIFINLSGKFKLLSINYYSKI